MPRPTCQINVSLDVPQAEWVERIASEINVRPSRAGQVLLRERLTLEKAGWRCDDKAMGEILEAVASLDEKGRRELRNFLEILGVAHKVDPVPDSYFRTGVLRSKAV